MLLTLLHDEIWRLVNHFSFLRTPTDEMYIPLDR